MKLSSRSFLNIAGGVALGMVGALCGALTYQTMTVPYVVGTALTSRVDTSLDAIGKRLDARDKQVGEFFDKANKVVGGLDKQVTDTRKEVLERVDRINNNVNGLGSMVVTMADKQLTATNDSVAKAVSIADPAKKVVETFNADILPVFSDCENNPSCITNRWIGLSYDLEQSLRQFEKASKSIPPTMESVKETAEKTSGAMGHVEGIAGDVHKVTNELTGPKPWYKKLWGVVKGVTGVGALMAR